MDLATRRRLHAACDPNEPLDPSDPRFVDLRGSEALARRASGVLLAGRLSCRFVSSGRGAGLSTELRSLASEGRRAGLQPVLVDVAAVLNTEQPLQTPELLTAVLAALLGVFEGTRHLEAVAVLRRPLLREAFKRASPSSSEPAEVVRQLRFSREARRAFRLAVDADRSRFLDDIQEELTFLADLGRRAGKAFLVIVDGLTALGAQAVGVGPIIEAARRTFVEERLLLQRLPFHVLWTVPLDLALRMSDVEILEHLPPAHSENLMRLEQLVDHRVNPQHLALLGAPPTGELARMSGGSPWELVSLLRELIEAGPGVPFDRVAARRSQRYSRALSHEEADILWFVSTTGRSTSALQVRSWPLYASGLVWAGRGGRFLVNPIVEGVWERV